MKWLRKIKARSDEHAVAADKSRALLAEALETEGAVDEQHRQALDQLCEAIVQSRKLRATDRQNHYSESLTLAFRGRTAG